MSNILTISRFFVTLLLLPLLLLQYPWAIWVAFIAFLVAIVTDFLDGYIARKTNTTSDLGACLDPIADKFLVTLTLFVLLGAGQLPHVAFWAAVIILGREIIISSLREYLAARDIPMPVSRLAKWKTAAQMAALACLILGGLYFWIAILGQILLVAAAGLTAYTGWQYWKFAKEYLY